ncbi:acyl-CoA-binding domain-containing protein 5A isoform 2-T2 [Menidia menidia]
MEVASVTSEEKTRLTQLRFDAAVKVIKSLPPDGPFQPSNDMMLKFYSYYKQATVGPCNIPRPGFWDAVGKAKWDAWNSLADMPKEEAMTAYVDEMKLIIEGMPMTDEVEELLRVLGPFYEMVDEKKKISQISDLSSGFGTMMNTVVTSSVAKSIVRDMEMNGTLETRPTRLKLKQKAEQEDEDDLDEEDLDEDEEEDDEEEEDEEEEEEEEEVKIELRKDNKSAVSQPTKKSLTKRHKGPISNGKLLNGVTHLTNGSHSRAALNSDDTEEGPTGEPLLNGHHADPRANHLASDSDSEVYCDSVDQFGQEESSEHNRSLDDLDEEESPALPPLGGQQEDARDPPLDIRRGGEDGEPGGVGSLRPRPEADISGGSLAQRGQGSRSPGLCSGPLLPVHRGGGDHGDRWGGAATPRGSLKEQIVVALACLQEDMQSVLERLHTLEAQVRSVTFPPTHVQPPANKKRQKPSWWPFDISPASLAFAVVWPFIVQWLIRLYMQRRRRRIN